VKVRLPATIALVLAGLPAASTSAADRGDDPSARPATQLVYAPGVGVLCLLGLTTAAAEVGRRCRNGQNPAFQAELDRSVTLFDEYVRRNSNTTPEDVAAFKREQGLVGALEAEVCTGDPLLVYEHLAAAGADALRGEVDRLVSRPGTPTWGDCL